MTMIRYIDYFKGPVIEIVSLYKERERERAVKQNLLDYMYAP